MSQLNDLIERLYQETIADESATQPSSAAERPATPTGEGAHLMRLRQALDEMGSLLRQEDQLQLDVDPPTDAVCVRILNHWESMMQSIRGIQLHMQSLEGDIQRMQPWGDFDVMKVEQLANRGRQIRFWSMDSLRLASSSGDRWYTDGHVLLVAREGTVSYFVTVTPTNQPLPMPPEAQQIDICPCPISTLIMLQTRYKDALIKQHTQLEDYAFVHYAELYTSLRQALPPGSPLPQLRSSHTGLRQKIKRLLHH